MTILWLSIGLAALAAALWIARPLFRRSLVELNEADSAVAIYRDQVDELRRDLDAGLLNQTEFEAAEEEIEARAVDAANRVDFGLTVSRRSPIAAMMLAAFAVAASVAVYSGLGTPALKDQPLAQRRTQALQQRAEAGDLNSRIQILIDKTKKNPDSFEDWWMLARSYSAVGDHASAVDAYQNAVELSGDRPTVLAAYAESMTLANGNKVPQAARLIFEQILQSTPDPRARYYVALSKAQAQDFEAAIDDWTALARDSEPGAPWMALVRRDIVNMARFLKKDVRDYLPDANEAEIAKAGGGPQQSTPDLASRAEALAASLADNPKDYKNWIALAEVRTALGRHEEAADAINSSRREFAGAPFVLAKFDEAERALGMDVLGTERTARGPDADDIAAAATMTDDERADMIEGMVAGFAARLEENPNDPDGWIMLIRSYSTLGREEKAKTAYDTALQQFAGNEAVLARVIENTQSLITAQ